MKNKILLSVIVFSILASLATVSGYLESNFYFTMQPNSTECLYTTLPGDLGFLENDNYTVEIDSGFETNLNFIQVLATNENAVKIPICFSSKDKKEGDNTFYNITISSNKLRPYEFKGGICVSKTKVGIGGQHADNPCQIANGLADLFWFDVYPLQTLTSPGQEETVYLNIWAAADMELDIKVNTSAQIATNSFYLRMKARESKQFDFKIQVPSSGEYYLNITARAVLNREYCTLPFCRKDVNAKISTGGFKPSKEGTWSFMVIPRFLSVYDQKPIEYAAIIENNKDDRTFDISLNTPSGIQTDTKNITDFVRKGERKEYRFNATITNPTPQSYSIDFAAKADVERVLTAFLSLQDSGDEIKRSWDSVRQGVDDGTREEIDGLVDQYLTSLKDNGFDMDQYIKVKTKIQDAQTKGSVQSPQPTAKPPPKTDNTMELIVFVSAPIIVVVVLVVFLFSRKRKVYI